MYASHLNHATWSGSRARSDDVLLHLVEAAAVHLPELAADPGVDVGRVLRRPERLVEEDEVERRADPRHRGDDVQPAEAEVEPVGERVRERERKASAPPPPVLRDRDELAERGLELLVGRVVDPLAEHLEDLVLRAPVRRTRRTGIRDAPRTRRSGGRAPRARPGRRPPPARPPSARRAPCAGRSRDARRGSRASRRRAARGRACAPATSGSGSAASRSTKRVRPSKSSASSSALSSRGSSRTRTERRGGGRGSGRRRARPAARPA